MRPPAKMPHASMFRFFTACIMSWIGVTFGPLAIAQTGAGAQYKESLDPNDPAVPQRARDILRVFTELGFDSITPHQGSKFIWRWTRKPEAPDQWGFSRGEFYAEASNHRYRAQYQNPTAPVVLRVVVTIAGSVVQPNYDYAKPLGASYWGFVDDQFRRSLELGGKAAAAVGLEITQHPSLGLQCGAVSLKVVGPTLGFWRSQNDEGRLQLIRNRLETLAEFAAKVHDRLRERELCACRGELPPVSEAEFEIEFDPDQNEPLQAALDPPAVVVVAGGAVESCMIFVGCGRPDAAGPVKIGIGAAEGPGFDSQGKDIAVVLADSAGGIERSGEEIGAGNIRKFALNVSARSMAPLSVAKVPIEVSQTGGETIRLTLWVAVNPSPAEAVHGQGERRPYTPVARKAEGEGLPAEAKRPELITKPAPPTGTPANLPAVLTPDGFLDLTLVSCRLGRQEARFVITNLGPENPQKPNLLKVGAVLQFIFDLADGRSREASTLSLEDIARVLNTPSDESLIILRFVLPDGDTRDITHPGRLF